MAAALRAALPKVSVAILDSPAQKKGWKSFEAELQRLRPTYVGIGEEAVSCREGLRAARLAKELGATVVAGGCFFGNLASEVLSTRLVDVVVHGEGEQTIVELTQVLESRDRSALRGVQGISYRDGEQVIFTGMREPMRDLDALPMPAFDLLPMDLYGRGSRNHPALVALELSRGCPHECSFCVLWRQMGKFTPSGPVSCYRTKSPERLFEEVRYVRERFARKYIGWVDPCFNASPTVPWQFSELLRSRDIKIGQSAWVRADYLCRDAASGAFDGCVKSGLNELYIGVERRTRYDLGLLNKNSVPDDAEIALRYIADKHPEVCTVGSFIFGIPGETPESLRQMIRQAYELPLDVTFLIPLTPLPGTPYWRSEAWDGSGECFSKFNFLMGNSTGYEDIQRTMLRTILTYWPVSKIRGQLRGIFAKDCRRRSVALRHFARSLAFLFRLLLRYPHSASSRLPSWYET
jgi:anaerobic magnesium-protoporphyrin IX monomethyl ester cyclase